MTTQTARSMSVIGVAVLLAAAPHADEKLPKCFNASRDGHCVAVWVNSQQTVKLTKKTKKMLEPLGGLKSGGDDTRYEVSAPIRGALELRADWLPEARAPKATQLFAPLIKSRQGSPHAPSHFICNRIACDVVNQSERAGLQSGKGRVDNPACVGN